MLKNQFINFVDEVKDKGLNIYDNKIINIIIENFEDISIKSKATRILYITDIIKTKYRDIDNKIKDIEVKENKSNEDKLIRLTKIEIENFRGYTIKQVFEFSEYYSIICGGNGTGKSSFTEALEYSLMGKILEAKERKIDDIKYVRNQFNKKFTPPVLYGINLKGEPKKANLDKNSYHFSFIERNRIDNFSRIDTIGAQNSKIQLGKLFGINDFNNFIIDFNGNIEDKLIIKNNKNDIINKVDFYKEQLEKNYIVYKNIEDLSTSINNNKEKEVINNNLKDRLDIEITKKKREKNNIKKTDKKEYFITVSVLFFVIIILNVFNIITNFISAISFVIVLLIIVITYNIKKYLNIKKIPILDENIKSLEKEREEIKSYRDIIEIGSNLIELLDKEKETILKSNEIDSVNKEMKKYIISYENIKKLLNEYRDNLYLSIIDNIEKNVVEFYNKIIKNDIESKKIKSVKIPKIGDEEIIIEFLGGDKYNALSILNEGHLKILGLSILLAKANYDKLPFLILDDIVNSIDNKFRNGIIDLLFKDEKFLNTQIILATHSLTFHEKIVNDPEIRERVKTLSLTKNNGVISLEEGLLSYLDNGKIFLDKGFDKYALHNLRLGLEKILGLYWKKLGGFDIKIKDLSKKIDIKKDIKIIRIIKDLENRLPKGGKKIEGKNIFYNEILLIFNIYIEKEGGRGASVNLKFTNKGSHIIESENEEDLNSIDIKEFYDNLIKLESLFKKI